MDEETLVAPTGPLGDGLIESMLKDLGDQSAATAASYHVIRLPNVLACNVVSVNGTVLLQDTACTMSRQRLEAAAGDRQLEVVYVDSSELAKKDAALTCCSVLLDI